MLLPLSALDNSSLDLMVPIKLLKPTQMHPPTPLTYLILQTYSPHFTPQTSNLISLTTATNTPLALSKNLAPSPLTVVKNSSSTPLLTTKKKWLQVQISHAFQRFWPWKQPWYFPPFQIALSPSFLFFHYLIPNSHICTIPVFLLFHLLLSLYYFFPPLPICTMSILTLSFSCLSPNLHNTNTFTFLSFSKYFSPLFIYSSSSLFSYISSLILFNSISFLFFSFPYVLFSSS